MDVIRVQDLIQPPLSRNSMTNGFEDEFFNNDPGQDYLQQSTILPTMGSTIAAKAPANVTIIVVVSLSIILLICILFLLAIFIDCRQQKINERQKQSIVIKKRKTFGLRLPNCRRVRSPRGIIEDAEDTSHTIPPLETITETV